MNERTPTMWFKSSYSGEEGDNCVEISYEPHTKEGDAHIEAVHGWQISSYSGEHGSNCVEVAASPHTIRIRDSKNPSGPQLTLPATTWAAFTGTLAARPAPPPLTAVRSAAAHTP
ncbi:DUF397 domain-containing protein [Streptomyces sp. NPDC052396]|uniref:DUF397 domain-containing protein n=1 Tax=Streptomyces sp. NPDC052396 TaxID=3365689 RepID=UPI0037D67F72